MGTEIKANFLKRLKATLINYLLFLLSTYLYVLLSEHDNNEGDKTVSGLLFLPIPLTWFIY